EFPQHWRRGRAEHSHPVQHLVEPGTVRHGAAVSALLSLYQLQDVAGGDVVEQTSLGAHDDGSTVHDVRPGSGRDIRIAAADLSEPGESGRVTSLAHAPG